MIRKAPVNNDTWRKYERGGHCGLCANSGFLNVSGLKTPAGVSLAPVVQAPCICPNGRAIEYAAGRSRPVVGCGRVPLDDDLHDMTDEDVKRELAEAGVDLAESERRWLKLEKAALDKLRNK